MKAIVMDNAESQMMERKPGRPKAIPERLISKVLTLYQEGMGYRALARELRHEGISVDWSTVRRLVKTSGLRHTHENSDEKEY